MIQEITKSKIGIMGKPEGKQEKKSQGNCINTGVNMPFETPKKQWEAVRKLEKQKIDGIPMIIKGI